MSEVTFPGGAFILQDGQPIKRVRRGEFQYEDDFQNLLAEHPQLLSGDLIDPEDPLRWILIDREFPIGDTEDSDGRWAVDHLFIDHRGTPTFVEVKRRSDSRLKRDVVAQILSYVAFASAYLQADRLRDALASRLSADGADPDEALSQLLGPEGEPAEFWSDVSDKLASGRVRALIVADDVPMELRRVLEFVNEKMEDVELLGLELQLYSTEGYRTLVPRIVGRTAHAQDRRIGSASRKWTMDEVLQRFADHGEPNPRQAISQMLGWADREPSVVVEPGGGAKYPTLRFRLQRKDYRVTFIVFWPDGPDASIGASLYFGSLSGGISAFEDPKLRRSIARRIHDEIDPHFDAESFERYPSFAVQSPESFEAVTRLMDYIVRRVDAGTDLSAPDVSAWSSVKRKA